MTAEDLDALAADVGRTEHAGCDLDCESRVMLELARGYLSLRLVQADHERQIAALGESKRFLQEESDALQRSLQANLKTAITLERQIKDVLLQNKALQAAYDDVQAALMKSIAQVEDLRDRLMDADEDISKLEDAQY